MSSPSPDRPDRVTTSGVSPRQVLAIVLAVLALVFIFQNDESIAFQVLVVEVTAPLWVVSLALLAIGMAIGWMLASRRAKRRA